MDIMRYGQEAKSLALAMDPKHSTLQGLHMAATISRGGQVDCLGKCQEMVKGLDLNIQTGKVESFALTSVPHVRK
jgi:hypothetical protein